MILERIGILRSMRKRRVGVTARSRQNDGNQATGTLQFVTEMAAPLEFRTPAGTCGGSCKQSADGSMATKARESTGRVQSEERSQGERDGEVGRGTARYARMRRCLILRQGASPLSPPAPFPSGSRFQNGGNLSRVRKPRNNGAPLTNPLRSEDATEMRERGPSAKRAVGRVIRGRESSRKCPNSRYGVNTPYLEFGHSGRAHLSEKTLVWSGGGGPDHGLVGGWCLCGGKGHRVVGQLLA